MLSLIDVRARLVICVDLLTSAAAGCASSEKKVDKATKSARSWAATVKVVAEQWAQSRVSLRFTRTTLNTAAKDLARRADSIRSIDAPAALRIDHLRAAIDPVMAAVASNEPDRARDAAKALTAILEPEPVAAAARPDATAGTGAGR